MNINEQTLTFTVDQPIEQVFDAILNVPGWWGRIEGTTDTLWAEWTYTVGEMHYSKFRVTELDRAKTISWLVVESFLSFVEDKEEWTGTALHFELVGSERGTEVRFTHRGLVPQHACYDVCSNAWSEYIHGSLKSLITTGIGRPNSLEGDDAIDAARA
jgi:uncharacterized protein YndB with AHSA1/START domain